MREKFVGFYWTLPVQMAGFTHLPSDAEKAAKKSRTIRYQRERVRQWLKENKQDDPIREFTFLEVQDDRGSDHIKAALEKAAQYCVQEGATLLLVGFGMEQSRFRARRHIGIKAFLMEWDRREPARSSPDSRPFRYISLPATPVEIDGNLFDPAEYFQRRRAFNRKWAMRLRFRAVSGLRAAMAETRPGPGFPERVAAILNEKGIKTSNGKQWTTDNVERAVEGLKAVDRLEKALSEVPEGPSQSKTIAQILNAEKIRHYSGDSWTAAKVENAIKHKMDIEDPTLTERELDDLMIEIRRSGG